MTSNGRPFIALDKGIRAWLNDLQNKVGLRKSQAVRLATTIAEEVSSLSETAKSAPATGGPVSVRDRLDELVAFQAYMDRVACSGATDPVAIRAQVIVQNYVCFVYLGDACFKSLRDSLPPSAAGRCCAEFLLNDPVRAFRNAVAHAQWRYQASFKGLEFWARRDPRDPKSLVFWSAKDDDLAFWQALARTTAYATFLTVLKVNA